MNLKIGTVGGFEWMVFVSTNVDVDGDSDGSTDGDGDELSDGLTNGLTNGDGDELPNGTNGDVEGFNILNGEVVNDQMWLKQNPFFDLWKGVNPLF